MNCSNFCLIKAKCISARMLRALKNNNFGWSNSPSFVDVLQHILLRATRVFTKHHSSAKILLHHCLYLLDSWGVFTCSILASIVTILVSIVVILMNIEPILEKPLQHCFKTYKYCDNTCEYYTYRWTHFSSICSILVSITTSIFTCKH